MTTTASLVRLLLAHQRRMESFTAEDPPPLGLLESHLIAEVVGRRTCSFSDFGALGIERSKLSRLAASLARSGEIALETAADDRRSLIVKVTAHGKERLRENDAHMSRILLRVTDPLNDSERSQLASLLDELADGLELPKHIGTQNPLLSPLRRLSRGTGMVGGRFADAATSPIEFQILLLLESLAKPLRKMSLQGYLSLPASSLSRALTALTTQGLILATKDSSDERAELIALASSGRDYVAKVLEHLSLQLDRAVRHMGAKGSGELERLLKAYAGEPHHAPLSSRHVLTPLRSEEERATARGFVAELLVRLHRARDLPAQLLPSDAPAFLVTQDNQIVGCIECSAKEVSKIQFCLFDPECVNPEVGQALQKQALQQISKEREYTSPIRERARSRKL